MIIYKTTNLINGKIYVGQDCYNDPKYLGSGVYLKRALKKYGTKNFKKEILEDNIESLEILDEKEKYWIKELNSRDKKIGYNIAEGGHKGWFKDCKHRKDSKKKISYGIKNSEKYLSNSKNSELHHKRMSESLKGHPGYNKGGQRTEIEVENISEGVRKAIKEGKCFNRNKITPEFIQKQSFNTTGAKNPNSNKYVIKHKEDIIEIVGKENLLLEFNKLMGTTYKHTNNLFLNIKENKYKDWKLIEVIKINYRSKD